HFRQEVMGGVTNFLTILYIIIVNPVILNCFGKGFPINPSITATILLIVIMTTMASLVIKLPFVIAPGMGMNAMVSFTMILHDKMPIPIALGVIFWSSCILLLFSISNLRQKIINVIPESIQIALSVGIGLFLILIGVKNAGIIISNPETLLTIHKVNYIILLSFFGFILATVLFIRRKNYAFILPIIVVTLLGFLDQKTVFPKHFYAFPDFSLFWSIDFIHSFRLSLLPAILSLFLINFFDATSSVIGLISQLDAKSQKNKNNYYKNALVVDATAGIVSGLVGTSPGAVFVESSAGIQNGAKTGFASLVTAVLCIPFLFLAPIVSIVPSYATSPILILVGMLMMTHLRKIDLKHMEDFIATILTIIMMPLAFSITAGAVFGIISYTILKILVGKYHELNKGLLVVAICCIGWFFII
ncbi:MAG: NCS2 family permease, partial [Bacteroidia bacterium]